MCPSTPSLTPGLLHGGIGKNSVTAVAGQTIQYPTHWRRESTARKIPAQVPGLARTLLWPRPQTGLCSFSADCFSSLRFLFVSVRAVWLAGSEQKNRVIDKS